MPPVGAELGPREIGDVWHATLQEFAEDIRRGALPPEARERLACACASALRAAATPIPRSRALRWPRIVEGARRIPRLRRRAARASVEQIWVERGGELEFRSATARAFKLTARADRIEVLRGGGAALIDYKTGAPPGAKEVKVGFAPQLTLEAAMLARGAFDGRRRRSKPRTRSISSSAAPRAAKSSALKFKDANFGEVVEQHFAGLKVLLDAVRATGRRPICRARSPNSPGAARDYDHLARVKEWSATGGDDDDGGDAP